MSKNGLLKAITQKVYSNMVKEVFHWLKTTIKMHSPPRKEKKIKWMMC